MQTETVGVIAPFDHAKTAFRGLTVALRLAQFAAHESGVGVGTVTVGNVISCVIVMVVLAVQPVVALETVTLYVPAVLTV